jgi:phosphoenolpyruvate-protein phosphotransferase
MKKGVPVSPGVVVARAYCLDPLLPRTAQHEPLTLDGSAVAGEISRFEKACAAASRELDALIERVARQVGEEEAGIFRAHRVLLRDPSLINKVKTAIHERHVDAASAIQAILDEYARFFNQSADPFLQERMADLRDVVQRILAHLPAPEAPQSSDPTLGNEPVILVAAEILPSQALSFDRRQIAGLLTETGGPTGHAAILARSLNIPAVSGIRGLLREIHTGDLIALDGREGHVYLNPGPEVESFYRKLQREYVDLCGKLIENRDEKPVTPDGVAVELLANVNNLADAVLATEVGADGVGLYRTEYLFLTHPSVPDEEEQLTAYRAVIEAAPNQTVTIRTLDLGGDKQVPYLGKESETNPFMGFRSIRLSSAYPEFFQTQLRAILRAARHGKVSLLFPMITTLEEVLRLKKVVHQTLLALQKAGVPHCEKVPLGIMLEVPAAAMCAEELVQEVDFISIGSNDLTQYLMAADRDNPRVAHLCEPFAPALLRLLNQVIHTCVSQGKPATLCGEMAGRPRCVVPLLGMGLRSFSMSPAFVPSIKALIRRASLDMARTIAQHALHMHTVSDIRSYLGTKVQQVWPEVTWLDVRK